MSTIRHEFEGQIHEFPDDFTDDEVRQALESYTRDTNAETEGVPARFAQGMEPNSTTDEPSKSFGGFVDNIQTDAGNIKDSIVGGVKSAAEALKPSNWGNIGRDIVSATGQAAEDAVVDLSRGGSARRIGGDVLQGVKAVRDYTSDLTVDKFKEDVGQIPGAAGDALAAVGDEVYERPVSAALTAAALTPPGKLL